MKLEKLNKLFEEGLDIISNPKDYKNIINMKNNLYKLDVINRVLLYVQNRNAFDIKTALEWSVVNRDIKKNQKPVYIIMPVYDSYYIDTETNRIIEDNELNIDEINRAIKYNIIKHVENIRTTSVVSYFDIRQTVAVNNCKYTPNKPIIKSSSLLQLVQDITGSNIEISEMDYYSKKENIIYIRKQHYKELLKTVSDILYHYYIDYIKLNNINNIDDFGEYEKELLHNTVRGSIESLFGNNIDYNFDTVYHISKENIIKILNINNSIIIDIASKAKFTNEDENKDAYHSLEVIRKAEAILNIMEANNISKIMKGV